MVLTTLAGQCLPEQALSEDDALVYVLRDMVAWAESSTAGLPPSVPNPSLKEENLARDWRYSQFIEFRTSLIAAYQSAYKARWSDDEEDTIRLWNRPHLFDGRFPTTVLGLGKDYLQTSDAFNKGLITVGTCGGIGVPGIKPYRNKGFYGES